MIPLTGEHLRSLPVGQLEHVRDLIAFDGPLLSQMAHRNGDQYLNYWCDCNETANRWMLARVSETHILRLVNRFVPLDYVIPRGIQDDFAYFVDIDGAGGVAQVVLQLKQDIPAAYVPAPGAYLPATVVRDEHSYSALIEGDLPLDVISEMPRTYSQAYAFLYVLRSLRPERFQGLPWRGGFSAMHFFREIVDMVPGEQRPNVAKFQYASPGFIQFAVNRATATDLAQSIAHLSQAGEMARLEYSRLFGYVRDNHLNDSGAAAEANWEQHNPQLLDMTRSLLAAVNVQEGDAVISASRRPFEAAKIAMAFYRRLAALAHLDREGLVRFPAE